MTTSSSSSNPPSLPLRNKALWVIMALALVGLADAAYLTANHYMGTQVGCSVTQGCELVLGSDYATVQGVPISLIGVLYYAGVFLAAYYFRMTADARFRQAYTAMVTVATLVTCYLVYLQLAVIDAICQYCIVSAVLTYSLALTILVDWRNGRKPAPPAAPAAI